MGNRGERSEPLIDFAENPTRTYSASKPWTRILAPYKESDLRRSVLQLLTSAVPFALIWYAMLRSLDHAYWITLLLAVPAGGFLLRLFILQHDCGHGSFFKSPAANDTLGSFLGVLTLSPYHYWRKTHALHHATSGNLDRRGAGDIDTLTVKEYLDLPKRKRLAYRLYRNPFILFGIGPAFYFIVKQRFPPGLALSCKKEWASIHWTNLAILAVVAIMWKTIGIQQFLMVQLPIITLASSIGVWFFYVQHQFEHTYWQHSGGWDFHAAALRGSSYYDLPKILRWFSGNIGLHHIHHLCSRIPNYRLQECFNANRELQQATRLTLRQSLTCISLRLWDEEQQKLVRFRSPQVAE